MPSRGILNSSGSVNSGKSRSAGTTSTTRSLICTGLTDPADAIALNTTQSIVLPLFGTSTVEDIANAGNGQTSFSHQGVERQNSHLERRGFLIFLNLKFVLLFILVICNYLVKVVTVTVTISIIHIAKLDVLNFKRSVISVDLYFGAICGFGAAERRLKLLAELEDLVTTSQKHQNITRWQLLVASADLSERLLDIIVLRPSREMRGRHDDELQGLHCGILRGQLGSKLDNSAEHTNKNIRIGTSFVSFVNNNGGVFLEGDVLCNLTHQHTISHELDRSFRLHCALKTNLISDRSRFVAKFLSNSLRHTDCGDSTGLRDADKTRRCGASTGAIENFDFTPPRFCRFLITGFPSSSTSSGRLRPEPMDGAVVGFDSESSWGADATCVTEAVAFDVNFVHVPLLSLFKQNLLSLFFASLQAGLLLSHSPPLSLLLGFATTPHDATAGEQAGVDLFLGKFGQKLAVLVLAQLALNVLFLTLGLLCAHLPALLA
ncbi:hypothetical protein HG531_006384 [Fusarium graminearum]|nr:hypothetical protein HG531_006384 [Fusarium graminearum]